MSKILLTGGNGLIGTELKKLMIDENIDFYAPSHKEMDILTDGIWDTYQYSLIVHCAAYTDVANAEFDKKICYDTNVIGTRNLALLGIPMIYISTDGVFNGRTGNYGELDYPDPVNFYGLTKLLGEYEAIRTSGVTIRTSFKPRPFNHDGACVDQFTSADYVDVIAPKIMKVIQNVAVFPRTIHVGTGRKTVYELAKISKPDVFKITREDVQVRLPYDISLNTELYDQIVQKIYRK